MHDPSSKNNQYNNKRDALGTVAAGSMEGKERVPDVVVERHPGPLHLRDQRLHATQRLGPRPRLYKDPPRVHRPLQPYVHASDGPSNGNLLLTGLPAKSTILHEVFISSMKKSIIQ